MALVPKQTKNTRKIELPKLHESQLRLKTHSKRFNVFTCGRRFGKTIVGIDIVVNSLLKGEKWAWIAPSYKTLSEVWRLVVATVAPVTVSCNGAEHRLQLITGGIFEAWSAGGIENLRGRNYHGMVIDEAAIVRNLEEAWNTILRPTLVDHKGCAYFLSTPRGTGTFFHRIFLKGQDPEDQFWYSDTFPTNANPFIDPEEIEASKADLPERYFQQEYMASFIDVEGAVFRNVLNCATGDMLSVGEKGHRYIQGIDWAKQNDYTVITTIDIDERRVVNIDRFNKIDYFYQRDRVKALNKRFFDCKIIAEENNIGSVNIEELKKDGLNVRAFVTTNERKNLIIEKLIASFEHSRIIIPNYSILVGELLAFGMKLSKTGKTIYAGEGHDDCVMSLAIAWDEIEDDPKKRSFRIAII